MTSDDLGCLEFEPDPDLPPVWAILGRAVAPELTPENCFEQWATLPVVDTSDEAIAFAELVKVCAEAGI